MNIRKFCIENRMTITNDDVTNLKQRLVVISVGHNALDVVISGKLRTSVVSFLHPDIHVNGCTVLPIVCREHNSNVLKHI